MHLAYSLKDLETSNSNFKSANWQKASSWLFTSVAEDFNSGRPRTNAKSPERDSNPERPDCESDALTTRPKLVKLKKGSADRVKRDGDEKTKFMITINGDGNTQAF